MYPQVFYDAPCAGPVSSSRAQGISARIMPERLDGRHILAHVRVDIAAYARGGQPPPHLSTVIACVRSWRVVRAIRSLVLTVHTNDAAAAAPLLATDAPQRLLSRRDASPIAWSERVSPWRPASSSSKSKPFLLAHAHLHAWQQEVRADQEPSNGTAIHGTRPPLFARSTAFFHLEDDVCPSPEGVASWAEDEALLIASGASAAGFQRTLIAILAQSRLCMRRLIEQYSIACSFAMTNKSAFDLSCAQAGSTDSR